MGCTSWSNEYVLSLRMLIMVKTEICFQNFTAKKGQNTLFVRACLNFSYYLNTSSLFSLFQIFTFTHFICMSAYPYDIA